MKNGIDILNIKRFDYLKENNSFMDSVFNDEEILYFNKHEFRSETIAGVYCAKEAFLKCLKMGINNYPLKDILILHDENGAPYIVLKGELKKIKYDSLAVSISHDGDYACAIVTINI